MLLYTAGPYSSLDGAWGTCRNIERAREVAIQLWQANHAVICPHSNTAHMDGPVSYHAFLAGDFLMISRCDAVVMLPGWEESAGACAEKAYAEVHGIRVFLWDDTHDRNFLLGVEVAP
jgi:hypothetical protein